MADHVWRFGRLEFDALAVDNVSQSRSVSVDDSSSEIGGDTIVQPQSNNTISLGGVRITVEGVEATRAIAELAELAGSVDAQPVPVDPVAEPAAELAGYYVLGGDRDVRLSTPDQSEVPVERWQFRTLDRVGTHEDFFRGLGTNAEDVADANPFADGDPALLGIPSTARKRRWLDPQTGQTEPAGSPDSTVTAEFGDVDRYLLEDGQTALDIDRPTLIYELAFEEEGPTNVTVWDDLERDKFTTLYDGATVGDATVGEDSVGEETEIRAWPHVFSTSHEFGGRPVVDNGLLRLRFDEDARLLRAWRWDETDGWLQEPLAHENYWLLDFDLKRITPVDVEAQLLFENRDTDALYALDALVERGLEDALWLIPPNEGDAVPPDLQTMLAPIASGRATDSQQEQELVRRSDLRR